MCRVCDGRDLEPAVDLGRQPWANHFLSSEEKGKEPFYPLRVVWCANCNTAQLDYTIPKETAFGRHTYLSGTTRALNEHFRQTAKLVDTLFFAGLNKKAALDIGSNDGTQLRCYQALGYQVLGVESAVNIAAMANEKGIPTLGEFFNLDLARRLGRKFQVINAAGVFFHLEELHSAAEAVAKLLDEDGVFVVQFLYMKDIMENLAFDQIYHEHLLYYTLQTLEKLLERHGLTLFDAHWAPIHGGSIIAFAANGRRQASGRLQELRRNEQSAGVNKLETYKAFAERIPRRKEEIREYLNRAKKAGKTIYGMGAPVKGNTLLNYCEIGAEHLGCLVEKNPLRRGLYSPGMHLPIVIEGEFARQPDIYFVLAWNFKNEILARHRSLLSRGVEFYFPIEPKQSPASWKI